MVVVVSMGGGEDHDRGVEEKQGSRGKSEREKEKTKLRERKRRAITTKIFNGLRNHGGYRLASRADVNDVLRELAREAGWIIEPDGTTYRRPSVQVTPLLQRCPACGFSAPATAWITRTTPNHTSTASLCGGDCSITASPAQPQSHSSCATPAAANVTPCIPLVASASTLSQPSSCECAALLAPTVASFMQWESVGTSLQGTSENCLGTTSGGGAAGSRPPPA